MRKQSRFAIDTACRLSVRPDTMSVCARSCYCFGCCFCCCFPCFGPKYERCPDCGAVAKNVANRSTFFKRRVSYTGVAIILGFLFATVGLLSVGYDSRYSTKFGHNFSEFDRNSTVGTFLQKPLGLGQHDVVSWKNSKTRWSSVEDLREVARESRTRKAPERLAKILVAITVTLGLIVFSCTKSCSRNKWCKCNDSRDDATICV